MSQMVIFWIGMQLLVVLLVHYLVLSYLTKVIIGSLINSYDKLLLQDPWALNHSWSLLRKVYFIFVSSRQSDKITVLLCAVGAVIVAKSMGHYILMLIVSLSLFMNSY